MSKLFYIDFNWSLLLSEASRYFTTFICEYFRLQPVSSTDNNIQTEKRLRWLNFYFLAISLLPFNSAEKWHTAKPATPRLTSVCLETNSLKAPKIPALPCSSILPQSSSCSGFVTSCFFLTGCLQWEVVVGGDLHPSLSLANYYLLCCCLSTLTPPISPLLFIRISPRKLEILTPSVICRSKQSAWTPVTLI